MSYTEEIYNDLLNKAKIKLVELANEIAIEHINDNDYYEVRCDAFEFHFAIHNVEDINSGLTLDEKIEMLRALNSKCQYENIDYTKIPTFTTAIITSSPNVVVSLPLSGTDIVVNVNGNTLLLQSAIDGLHSRIDNVELTEADGGDVG